IAHAPAVSATRQASSASRARPSADVGRHQPTRSTSSVAGPDNGVWPLGVVGPGPVEGDVLAGPRLARPVEAEPFHAGFDRAAPGGNLAGPDLRARRIERLDPLARRRGRPAQR